MAVLPGDPFRRNYGQLDAAQKQMMDDTKIAYEVVWAQLNSIEQTFGRNRDVSIAKTELQTSCMWAVRAITKIAGQE
jgi:hypothetical protein